MQGLSFSRYTHTCVCSHERALEPCRFCWRMAGVRSKLRVTVIRLLKTCLPKGMLVKTFLKIAALTTSLLTATNAAFPDDIVRTFDAAKLDAILAAQPEKTKARYRYRHPKETLEFFGVAPGMTVADTLPGAYYSRILLPYLGEKGALVGVSYSIGHRAIDSGDDKKRMERVRNWPSMFVDHAEDWRGGSKAAVSAFLFEDMPEAVKGTVDVFLVVRASHHLNKYEDNGNRRTKALADIYAALKPGGILGVVQHRSPAGNRDEWARGFKGYIKQAPYIEAIKAAGFDFVAASEINANPNDKPSESDAVWRLPPILSGSAEGTEKHAAMQAIGESDRMTLKFRKPE